MEDKSTKICIRSYTGFPNISQKNATDIKIVIDVMNTMVSSKSNIIALVTSDSDFTDLAKDIKAKGIEALGYGEKRHQVR